MPNKHQFELTEEQALAVGSDEARLTITAAAGTGKTRVLVERYLRHIMEHGLRPDQILAITYTRKAAAEMKSRIVAALRSLNRWEDAQIAETGPIQTLHSFCERILRENAVAAGLDAEFEILDQEQKVLDEAFIAELTFLGEESSYVDSLLLELAGRVGYQMSDLNHMLRHEVKTILDNFRAIGWTKGSLAEIYRSPAALASAFAAAMIADRNVVEAVRATVGENPGWSGLLGFKPRLPKGVKIPNWLDITDEAIEMKGFEYSCGCMEIALGVWSRYEDILLKSQKFDFTLVERLAVELLESNGALSERLRSHFHVALIDEAQDLNPMQYRLLQALGFRREMMVGDANQSIYGFRAADVELFVQRVQREGAIQLTQNKRSSPGILSFVDKVFEGAWPEHYKPMLAQEAPKTDDPFDSGTKDFSGVEHWKFNPRVGYGEIASEIGKLAEETDPSGIGILVRVSRVAQALAEELSVLGVPNRIIGGSETFYTRMETRDLANLLTLIENPADDFAMLAVLHSPIVRLSYDSLVLLGRARPIYDALETFEAPSEADAKNLQEFLRWFGPLRAFSDRQPAWKVIGQLHATTGYLEELARSPSGKRSLGNARKLLQLAVDRPEMTPRDFAESIREIQEFDIKEGEAGAIDTDDQLVTIMTIHKAKGLEFQTVVLPDISMLRNPSRNECDTKNGLYLPSAAPSDSCCKKYLTHVNSRKQLAEQDRLMYVALTRAKQRLCIVWHPDQGNSRPHSLLGHLLRRSEKDPRGLIIRGPNQRIQEEVPQA